MAGIAGRVSAFGSRLLSRSMTMSTADRTLYARYGSNVHVNPNRQSDAAPSKPATAMHVAIMRLLTGSPNHVTHARVAATAERRVVQRDVQE